jgi:excisionase family DNA binding protein
MKRKQKSNQKNKDLPLDSTKITGCQLILETADGFSAELPHHLNTKLLAYLSHILDSGNETVDTIDKVISTQEAADYLSVSRQHVVDLMDDGKIPAFKVGSHRRLYYQNVVLFAKNRDSARRDSLDRLFDSVAEAGLYDASYKS